jgi:stage II sporulation protein D
LFGPELRFGPNVHKSEMNRLCPTRKISSGARLGFATLLACALLAAPAGAATPTSASRFYIDGAGFGHGIGMSQYGAAGFALHGFTYQQILAHYYSTTTLGSVNPNRSVTVLLHEGAASFRGAVAVKGTSVKLWPRTNYGVIPYGSMLRIISHGRTIGTFKPPLTVTGDGKVLTLVGQGRYRGVFVFRPYVGGGVMTINSVGLDSYVRGVVAAEMPASWPAQALDAQAVAARTYAITAGAVASDFDVYDDTRSQMYEGVDAETPTSNAAVAATSGRVVEYNGQPVVTYFFASSGGDTESVQNVWYGVEPEAWLHGVSDPYDDSYNNPYYRWTDPYTVASAGNKLGKLYAGTFEGVNVTQTGFSPRVVQAQVVGSGGSTTVTGAQLQQLFGTLSTYMSFTTLTETGTQSSTPVAATTAPVASGTSTTTTTTPTSTTPASTTPTPPPTGGSGLTALATASSASGASSPDGASSVGGAGSGAGASSQPAASTSTPTTVTTTTSDLSVQGTIYPAQQGTMVGAQLDEAGGWTTVAGAQVTATGAYVIPVPTAGTYRVVYNGITGPNITVP